MDISTLRNSDGPLDTIPGLLAYNSRSAAPQRKPSANANPGSLFCAPLLLRDYAAEVQRRLPIREDHPMWSLSAQTDEAGRADA